MSESAVGAVLEENAFRWIQVGKFENGWKVENLAEVNLPVKFRLLTLNDDARFEEIRQLFRENIVKAGWAQKIGIAVNRKLLFIKETHVDPDLSDDEIQKQLFWEVKQFLPEDLGKSYKVFWVRVSPGNDLVLLIIFRKLLLERVGELFEETGETIQNMSVNQFAEMTAVEKLFEPKGRLIGVAHIGKTALTITLMRDGSYLRSKEIDLEDYEQDLLESDQELSKTINKEVDRVLLESEINESGSPVSQLYVFGDKATPSLVSALEGGSALEVKFANPFEKVEVPETLRDSVVAIENPTKWLAGFGAALEILD